MGEVESSRLGSRKYYGVGPKFLDLGQLELSNLSRALRWLHARVWRASRVLSTFRIAVLFQINSLAVRQSYKGSRPDAGGADDHRRASAAICRRVHLSFVRGDRDDVLCRSTAFRHFKKPGRAFQPSSFSRAVIGGDEIRLRTVAAVKVRSRSIVLISIKTASGVFCDTANLLPLVSS